MANFTTENNTYYFRIGPTFLDTCKEKRASVLRRKPDNDDYCFSDVSKIGINVAFPCLRIPPCAVSSRSAPLLLGSFLSRETSLAVGAGRETAVFPGYAVPEKVEPS